MKKYIFIFLFSVLPVYAQQDTSNVDPYRLVGLTGATIGGFGVSQAFQYDEYWSNSSDFSVMPWKDEYDDALLADKFGHLYFSYALARNYSNLLEWTGLSKEESRWYGAGVSMLFQTYVEINDGFSEGEIYLGFSRGDMITNAIGAAWPVVQYYYPFTENIKPKISFYRSGTSNNIDNIINDYESTNHWVSFDLFNILDMNVDFFPGIFSVAIGHSVANIDRMGGGYHQIYLSPDINWSFLKKYDFVKDSELLVILIDLLDSYKFPFPALELTNGLKLHTIR